MGAMKLVAESYSGEELNQYGSGMYVSLGSIRRVLAVVEGALIMQNDFKPVVERWGEKGILQCAAILEHVKSAPAAKSSETDGQPAAGGYVEEEDEGDDDLEDVLAAVAKAEAAAVKDDPGSVQREGAGDLAEPERQPLDPVKAEQG